MISRFFAHSVVRRSLFTVTLLAVLIAIGLLINAVAAWREVRDFALASDFPRGALVYAQFSDLPAMLKTWDASALKSRYVDSTNYRQLQTRHLALKLVSRWEEFNDATGFPIDSDVLASLADDRAAIAVYEIGRLDMVLIAPIGAEKLAASRFLQGKQQFQQLSSPEGVPYFLHDVEADKGRQKQQIGFAAQAGKFILASNEKLLLRAIANLSGQQKKDRLSDDPSFEALANAMTPHFATVWVDQAKLNDDWYFKKYWMMSRVADLKQMRAGIFDLEMREDKWIEHRQFLTDTGKLKLPPPVPDQIRQQIAGIVPADVPFVQLRVSDSSTADLIVGALFDAKASNSGNTRDWNWDRYDSSDFEAPQNEEGEESDSSRYAYLSHQYDEYVDDPDDAGEKTQDRYSSTGANNEAKTRASIAAILRAAGPTAEAKIARPRPIEGPLFVEFGRAAIIALAHPAAINPRQLEQAMAEVAAQRLMVVGAASQFEWSDQAAGGVSWRVMPLPALGRSLGYGIRGSMLILSGSPALLSELMTKSSQAADFAGAMPAQELTVIRLNQRAQAFDPIFKQLDAPRIRAYWKERKGDQAGPDDPSQEFFSGNIASLLDIASPVSEVRIERGYVDGRLKEEIEFRLTR